jgi:transcriptional regulator with XRE-family HTH domain
VEKLFSGERLRLLREERKMTQAELAKKINVSTPTITEYEIGKKTPRPDKLIKFAEFFDTSVDYLLSHTDERLPIDQIKKDVLPDTSETDLRKILENLNAKFDTEYVTRAEADFLISFLETMIKKRESKEKD